MAGLTLTEGQPWPLGASVDADGINFAVFSAHATAIELCLYNDDGTQELSRLPLPGRRGDVWHGHLRGAGVGTVYGLRAHGPWEPAQGHRFNPYKLLLDPYAHELVGQFDWQASVHGHDRTHPHQLDCRDNGAKALKARVVTDAFDWKGDRPPARAWRDTVLYEVHVKGFSQLHPDVPETERGSYAGLGSDAAIAHFKRLGITALNLLPVQAFIDDERLVHMGLRNYWGYNTLAYGCVETRYASSGSPRNEFRQMVRKLHAAGIEVILDVVYNHTAESDQHGATLSWRGLDNASYYRLQPQHLAHYVNHTGCGNTLNLHHPRVLQTVLDSLRYWVEEMHVDGFRFDLATVLGRGANDFEADGAFFKAVAQDPVLSRLKLIAEPWDLGANGYRLGQFPNMWSEWNDKFRDTQRGFWLGHRSSRAEFAQRLCGSSDVFQRPGREPTANLNYVVSHDGYTLRDLVSFEQRHNLANGEHNRDGHGHNLSRNGGVEGDTRDPQILQERARLQRALLSCLFLAQGTPMLAAGDELGHSQGGNNNPYCQDNRTTWIDWASADDSLLAFTAKLIALRRQWQPLGGPWLSQQAPPIGQTTTHWFTALAQALDTAAWHDENSRALALQICRPDTSWLLLFNGQSQSETFRLPAGHWRVMLDSSKEQHDSFVVTQQLTMAAHSVLLLQNAEPQVLN